MPTPRKYASDTERKAAYRKRTRAVVAALAAAKGLPAISPIPAMPSSTRWRAMIQSASRLLETARDEMSAYADERSEVWRETERATTLAEQIEAIEQAIELLED